MSSLTETMEAVLQPWFDYYCLPPSLDYLPKSLAKKLFDAFNRFAFEMAGSGEDVSNTEPLLEELFLWLEDDVTRQARRFLPSDVVLPSFIIESKQTFVPLEVRRLLHNPANLAKIIKHAQRIMDAHQACLNFNPAEMAPIKDVQSAVQKRNRGKQKRKVNKDDVIRRLQDRGWDKPGVLKKAIVLDVAESLGISESSVRLVISKKKNDK